MNSIEFSAIFESKENDISELGQAYIAADDSVTFTSDFVPLVKLGTKVSITRVLGEKRLERFVGKVYLSSRKLLRIVDVDRDQIAGALELFESNAIIPAVFDIMPAKNFLFGSQKQKPLGAISGYLRYISPRMVRICTMEYADAGQRLMFSIDEPRLQLENITVVVKERLLLMRSAALLLCEPQSLNNTAIGAIRNYMNQVILDEEM